MPHCCACRPWHHTHHTWYQLSQLPQRLIPLSALLCRNMELPPRLAFVAPNSWPIEAVGHLNVLPERDFKWLVFAIARRLLGKHALQRCFNLGRGLLDPPRFVGEQGRCCLSAPRGPPRHIKKSVGNDTQAGKPSRHGRAAAKELQELRHDPWLRGGVLKWRNDRWTYSPRSVSRAELKQLRTEIAELQEQLPVYDSEDDVSPPPSPSEEEEDVRAELRGKQLQLEWLSSPFVDVSRIFALQAWKKQQGSAADHGEEVRDLTPSDFACHYRCKSIHRARCIDPCHLGMAGARDNAYHAAQHRKRKGARLTMPDSFEFPSHAEGYSSRKRRR